MNIFKFIKNSSDNDISIDINDMDVIFRHHGYAYIDERQGQIDKVCKEIFTNIQQQNPKGVLLYYQINQNTDVSKIDKLMEEYLGEIMDDENVDLIEGQFEDNNLKDDEIIIGCIATGAKR